MAVASANAAVITSREAEQVAPTDQSPDPSGITQTKYWTGNSRVTLKSHKVKDKLKSQGFSLSNEPEA